MSLTLDQSSEMLLHIMDKIRQLGTDTATAPPIEANISASQLAVINFAAITPGCGIQAFADGLKLSKPSISINVRQLEDAGFIVRKPDPGDGRAVKLYLTKKGGKLQQRTIKFRRQKFRCLLKGLTENDRTTLINLLERALSAAENEEQDRK